MFNKDFSTELLRHELSSFVEAARIPGLEVAIVKKEQIVFNEVFGFINLKTAEPLQDSTLFHQASVSKTFVATAIMQLVESCQIDLDLSISTYLPYFSLDDARYPLITIRMLLSHTSGMPDEEDYGWDRPQYDEQSLEKYVKSISNLKLVSNPGETFSYSNIGYEILGDVIAKVAGMSFEHYMQQHILSPLGMSSSSFLKTEVDSKLASPHVLSYFPEEGYGGYVSQIFPYNRAHAPSSTLYTNGDDICEYLIMHLNRGITKNGMRLLKDESYDEMWKVNVVTGYNAMHSKMGLGWFIGQYEGSRILSHSGWDTGFLSELFIFPDDEIAISIMTNCDYVLTESLFRPIFDYILGDNTLKFKQSIAHKLAEAVLSEGIDVAVKQFEQYKMLDESKYYMSEYELIRISNLFNWSGRRDDGLAILQCASQLFTESSDIKNMLQQY